MQSSPLPAGRHDAVASAQLPPVWAPLQSRCVVDHVASGIVLPTTALQLPVAAGRPTEADGNAVGSLQVSKARLVVAPPPEQPGDVCVWYVAAGGHCVVGVQLQSQTAGGAFRSACTTRSSVGKPLPQAASVLRANGPCQPAGAAGAHT
jgi:hypothetical protein